MDAETLKRAWSLDYKIKTLTSAVDELKKGGGRIVRKVVDKKPYVLLEYCGESYIDLTEIIGNRAARIFDQLIEDIEEEIEKSKQEFISL